MIRWKLHEIMSLRRIRNKDLAQALGVTDASISRLRNAEEMPRLTADTLNGICKYLDVQPGDLLAYVADEEVSA
jgi:putative transcriptional regulator